MSGWCFYVCAADATESASSRLAAWETVFEGIHWIDRLVRAGRAEQVQGGGYPSRYKALAADVFPLLTADGSDAPWAGGGFVRKLDREAIAVCPPDQVVIITVWDQS
ncbi:MAG: hypothetical protein JSR26_11630 [Proteobacteria bacterium]|nr:hypothetical protein [Pseudomonadota bacterium]